MKSTVAAILAAESADGVDWRQETIDEIENAMIRIGDVTHESPVSLLAEEATDATSHMHAAAMAGRSVSF